MIILLFVVNLASSVLSFSLMKDMSVQGRVLADRTGTQVLVGSAIDGSLRLAGVE